MIECKYGKQKRLFINHLGELIPCCYLNAEALNIAAGVDMGSQGAPPLTLFGELNKKHDNSLYNKSIEEILDGPLFNGITESWDTDQPVEKCLKTCKIKSRDVFVDNFNYK
tara:strand:- start:492 stop:824 length:333 start_codon:yes stop_codon:yes gene_type:complete